MTAEMASSLEGNLTMDRDAARDSLHLLPLDMIPLHVPGLGRALLIKNVQLHTMIQLFHSAETGSGQIPIDGVVDMFDADPDDLGHDLNTLHSLARLNSFDVYSLRMELRRLNINVNDVDSLTLSARKKHELTDYMRRFTRPLVRRVFADAQDQEQAGLDIVTIITRSTRQEALSNLRRISAALSVELFEIPDFLEEYGDIVLSLAYFRSCLDQIVPIIHRYQHWQNELKNHFSIRNDISLKRNLDSIERSLNFIVTSITGRFEFFDRQSEDFWTNIDAETFRQLRRLIQAHHTSIGGVLCGLTVKMNMWQERFGANDGNPNKRVEFVRSEMQPGLSRIQALEEAAMASVR